MYTGLLMICSSCQNFIPPDPKYERNSLGLCSVLEHWLDSFPKRRADPKAYDTNFRALGNKLFWPNADRVCSKFLTKEQP
jgi:hypothetical protein